MSICNILYISLCILQMIVSYLNDLNISDIDGSLLVEAATCCATGP